MKITVNTALQSIQNLGTLDKGGKLPFQISLDISHNARQLDDIGKVYDKKRSELFKKFGKESDNGKIEIPLEKMEKFNEAMIAINAEEVDIEPRVIKAESIPKGFECDALVFVPLWWMIDEGR